MFKRFAVVGLLLASADGAWGQYPGYPGYPYPPAYGGRYGAMLSGAADVTRAQSDSWVQAEQARIMREQADQAKLDTKRKAFDEARYEKANTPTYAERKAATDTRVFQRVMVSPTPYEISSGESLNIMLPFLDSMARQGSHGPPTPLDPALLQMVNITLPGKPGLAILGDVDNIPWPSGLVGPLQEKLEKNLKLAVDSVRTKGRVDPKIYAMVQTGAKDLRADMDKRFNQEKINMSRFAEGSTFLTSLNKELVSLGDATAAKLLGPVAHPQGKDVLEVLGYMIVNGFLFAPARPGDESAYRSLHNAMAGFGQSAQVASRLTADPSLRVLTPQPSMKK